MKFRPCLPSDVDKAIPLIYASGPSSFDYVFKTNTATAQEFLRYAFQRNGGEFSFDNHYAITRNGSLIGVGSIFSGTRAKKFMIKDLLNILQFYGIGAIPVLFRGLRIEQILKLPTEKEICLAHLGIEENERSKGYGQKFISFLIKEVKNDLSSYFVLDVSEENPRAQSLYEKMGFKVHNHVLSNYKTKYGYVPNFFRMHLKP